MNLNELRIGIYIADWHYDFYEDEIFQGLTFEERELTFEDMDLINSKDMYAFYQPIMINHDWLIKLSITPLLESEPSIYDVEEYPFGFLAKESEGFGYYFTFQSQRISKKLLFIHELQNFVFSSTGNELKIKS